MNTGIMNHKRRILLAMFFLMLSAGLLYGMNRGLDLKGIGGSLVKSEPIPQVLDRAKKIEPARYSPSAGSLAAGVSPAETMQSGGIYSITRSVVGGGGGESANGDYKVTGTAGQSATANSSGGDYGVSGGFWNRSTGVSCAAININPSVLSSGQIGQPYSQQLTQTGGTGAVNWSVTAGALPGSVTLNPNTGLLSGTPTTAGAFNFTITATDANNCSGEQAYSITVLCPVITLSLGILAGGTVNTVYSQTVMASPAGMYVYTLTAGNLPAGLTLNSVTGAITGAPTATGTTNFTIKATDANNCFGEMAFSITVSSVPEYEADVAPRPNGDGKITVADWVQIGRFSVGLDIPAFVGTEFQRADCAPRTTLGDGKITVADWVQAGRYSVGLEPMTLAGGPTSAGLIPSEEQLRANEHSQGRVVRAVNTAFTRGRIGTVDVEFDTLGNENALSFTLKYDPRKAVFVDAMTEERMSEAILMVNGAQSAKGRVSIAIAMPTGKVFTAGTHRLLRFSFIPIGGEGHSSMEIGFDDSLIERGLANPDAVLLPQPEYQSANISIDGSSPTVVSAASYESVTLAKESIATIFGSALSAQTGSAWTVPLPLMLAGTKVTVTDSMGATREAQLFYVSPGQINFLVPRESAIGPAAVTITGDTGVVSRGLINIVDVAPGLFTTSEGMAAANLIQGDEGQAYLVLYGTGWRNLKDRNEIEVMIDGTKAQVLYAGAQGIFEGLDQINLLLPRAYTTEAKIEIRIAGNPINIARFRLR